MILESLCAFLEKQIERKDVCIYECLFIIYSQLIDLNVFWLNNASNVDDSFHLLSLLLLNEHHFSFRENSNKFHIKQRTKNKNNGFHSTVNILSNTIVLSKIIIIVHLFKFRCYLTMNRILTWTYLNCQSTY